MFVTPPFSKVVSLFISTRSLGDHPFPSFLVTLHIAPDFLLIYIELP